jgi:iron complex outermembrane recepter protein
MNTQTQTHTSHLPTKPLTLLSTLLFAVFAVKAQTQMPEELTLPTLVVTTSPLGAGASAIPAQALFGDELTFKKTNTIGQTLDRQLGVSATYFGPNASRPVIRGLDGDRIKMLHNGGHSHDVAGLSFDHATPIDPLVVERLEVLRGPSTLLHGGSAVGGVVNAIDNRISKSSVDSLSGLVELRGNSASKERSASALVETPLSDDKSWALHVDGFKRHAQSAAVPVALTCMGLDSKRICNTAVNASGGAIGVSKVWSQGYLGASVTQYKTLYGTPAEEAVSIDMSSRRLSVMGEYTGLTGLFQSLSGQINSTRYAHTELDAGLPATQFKKQGADARFELKQRGINFSRGALSGTSGLSIEREQFSATGSEAFVPPNQSQRFALFTVQNLKQTFGAISLGGRVERNTLDSYGGTQTDYLGNDKFVASQRQFNTFNLALGSVINLNPRWQLTGNLSSSQRAPTAYELYANGVHIATGAYEQGNPALAKELSRNIDVALKWQNGGHSLSMGGFYNRFSSYINLANTGSLIGENADPSGTDLALYRYQPTQAQFKGLEVQSKLKLSPNWNVDGKFDVLQAKDVGTGQALPRIAPMRLTLGANYAADAWQASIEWAHNAAQKRVPQYDSAGSTASYSLVNVKVSYRTKSNADMLWFVKLDNAFNRLGYNATTIDTVRAKSPVVGRNLSVGLQFGF